MFSFRVKMMQRCWRNPGLGGGWEELPLVEAEDVAEATVKGREKG